MTIYEIAEKANVSIATVSRAMTPELRHKVASNTLSRLDKVIKKSGYTPNQAAKSMGLKRFRTIGMVLPHFTGIFFSDYYVQALAGLADALLNSDYHFKLIMLKSNQFVWDEHNNLYVTDSEIYNWDKYDFRIGEGVDALLLNQWTMFFSDETALKKMPIPCVTLNDPVKTPGVNNISCDNFKGGWLAAEHLAQKGHRKIVVMTGPASSYDSTLRVDGFKSYFQKTLSGKYQLFFLNGNYHERMAAELTGHFLTENKIKATAFFCCNDLMAFGVLDRLKKMGFGCPKDFSVVGFDDNTQAKFCDPPLTTVQLPIYEMAKTATREILNYLEGGKSSAPFRLNKKMDVALIERKSCDLERRRES